MIEYILMLKDKEGVCAAPWGQKYSELRLYFLMKKVRAHMILWDPSNHCLGLDEWDQK